MAQYLVITGKDDYPIFTCALSEAAESKHDLNQFVMHAALDLVDERLKTADTMFMHRVDEFNDSQVSAFVTASRFKMLVLHDRTLDSSSLKSFFVDAYEVLLKAIANPFFSDHSPVETRGFRQNILKLASKSF